MTSKIDDLEHRLKYVEDDQDDDDYDSENSSQEGSIPDVALSEGSDEDEKKSRNSLTNMASHGKLVPADDVVSAASAGKRKMASSKTNNVYVPLAARESNELPSVKTPVNQTLKATGLTPIMEATMTIVSPQGQKSIMRGASIDEEPKSAARRSNYDDNKSLKSFKSLRSGKLGRQAERLVITMQERLDTLDTQVMNLSSQCDVWRRRHEPMWDEI